MLGRVQSFCLATPPTPRNFSSAGVSRVGFRDCPQTSSSCLLALSTRAQQRMSHESFRGHSALSLLLNEEPQTPWGSLGDGKGEQAPVP